MKRISGVVGRIWQAMNVIGLGDIVRMNETCPYFADWRGVEMKVIGIRCEPDGVLWASVIEGNPRHRGNGYYDGETTDIDICHLSLVSPRGNAQAVPAPVAWRLTDGEGDYEYLTDEPSDQSRAWSRRYGREWEPLYAS